VSAPRCRSRCTPHAHVFAPAPPPPLSTWRRWTVLRSVCAAALGMGLALDASCTVSAIVQQLLCVVGGIAAPWDVAP
jgi:hypothetical protein